MVLRVLHALATLLTLANDASERMNRALRNSSAIAVDQHRTVVAMIALRFGPGPLAPRALGRGIKVAITMIRIRHQRK
jgi:hypothetical protein